MKRHNGSELDQLVEQLKHVPTVKGLTVQLFYPYNQDEFSLTLSPVGLAGILIVRLLYFLS